MIKFNFITKGFKDKEYKLSEMSKYPRVEDMLYSPIDYEKIIKNESERLEKDTNIKKTNNFPNSLIDTKGENNNTKLYLKRLKIKREIKK